MSRFVAWMQAKGRNPGIVNVPGFHFMGEARYPLGIPSGLRVPIIAGEGACATSKHEAVRTILRSGQ